MSTTESRKAPKPVQRHELCIDLPGETVRCWRSDNKMRIRLRKHRDVFFEIKLQDGATYTVESKSDFYSPRDKKLLRKLDFRDGERCHVWVGRNFKGNLTLKTNGLILGSYEVNQLDTKDYGTDPKTKPEPLMVIMDKRQTSRTHMCTKDDPFGVGDTQQQFEPTFDPKLSLLKSYGSEFDYRYPQDPPQVNEYVAVTEATQHEIQPQVLAQLKSGVAVVGKVGQIFVAPKGGQEESPLYVAIVSAAGYISGSELLTGNSLKESLGYLQENFRELDKISMTVRVEKKIKGKYRVIMKGKPLSQLAKEAFGAAGNAKKFHERLPLGSKGSSFMDGGFSRSGKAGYGGAKRIILTTAENFRSGLKIQVIGTVIDIIVDANTVYFDEKGSKDLSEFLARAGVSIVKAGATAAIGSALAALVAGFLAAAGAPVALIVGVVVLGYIAAATLVDWFDGNLQVKERFAEVAR